MSNESVLISLLQNACTCAVVFPGSSRKYTYKVPSGMELSIDDRCVVDSPGSGLVVVQVVEVHAESGIDAEAAFKYKWLVSKVDLEGYRTLLEQEKTMEEDLKKLRRKTQVKKQIKSMLGELGDEELPESLKAMKEWL